MTRDEHAWGEQQNSNAEGQRDREAEKTKKTNKKEQFGFVKEGIKSLSSRARQSFLALLIPGPKARRHTAVGASLR
jgi:hypothetical protein